MHPAGTDPITRQESSGILKDPRHSAGLTLPSPLHHPRGIEGRDRRNRLTNPREGSQRRIPEKDPRERSQRKIPEKDPRERSRRVSGGTSSSALFIVVALSIG